MSDTNAGLGMVPCKTGCRCDDCEITRLTEQVEKLEAENERLEDEREVTLQSSEALCELYFEIAVSAVGADEVRRLRDEQSPGFALKYRSRIKERADTLQAQLDAVRGWLENNMTFYNTDEPEGPVLAAVSERIWYHATDDTESYPFTDVIQQALNAHETA